MKLKFFNLAKKLSYNSDHHTHHIGCVITRKNKIIGVGFNKLRTHVRSFHPFKAIHAEFAAILNVRNEELLNGSDIYIYREQKNGNPALSFPCSSCLKMLTSLGIKRIYYSDYNEYKEYKV